MSCWYGKAAPAAQTLVGLIAVTGVTVVGEQIGLPFRVAVFLFLGLVVAFGYAGARFYVSVILSVISAGVLYLLFTPVGTHLAHWNNESALIFLALALLCSRLARQAAKCNVAPVAAFAGTPPPSHDQSMSTRVARPAPMVAPMVAPMAAPPPRVAVVVENGHVEKIIAAESKVEVMVIDFDELKDLPDEAFTAETMEEVLTWHPIRDNRDEIGKLQTTVARSFSERGTCHPECPCHRMAAQGASPRNQLHAAE